MLAVSFQYSICERNKHIFYFDSAIPVITYIQLTEYFFAGYFITDFNEVIFE
jgi:hypothetical protein